MFVVTVNYQINPDHVEEFRAAILKNAAASRRDEPGCGQFDVCFSDDGQKCFLYEVYRNSDAFANHRSSAHFKEYDSTVKDWVVSKRVETFTRINNNE